MAVYLFDTNKINDHLMHNRFGFSYRGSPKKTDRIAYLNQFLTPQAISLSIRKTPSSDIDTLMRILEEEMSTYHSHCLRHWKPIVAMQHTFLRNELEKLAHHYHLTIVDEFSYFCNQSRVLYFYNHEIDISDTIPMPFRLTMYLQDHKGIRLDWEQRHGPKTWENQYRESIVMFMDHIEAWHKNDLALLEQKHATRNFHLDCIKVIRQSVHLTLTMGESKGLNWGEWALDPIGYEDQEE